MRIQSELCHIDSVKIIVKVSSWDGDQCLGSALGQGSSVYEAEDGAITRLIKRSNSSSQPKHSSVAPYIEKQGLSSDSTNKQELELPAQHGVQSIPQSSYANHQKLSFTSTSESQPLDWSTELAQIDMAISQLGWNRDQENKYLNKIFSLPNRQRITSYKILKAYLSNITQLCREKNDTVNLHNDDRPALLMESDKLINELNWTIDQAQEYLYQKMNIRSRHSLSINDLKSFNKLLLSELNHSNLSS